MTDEFSKSRNHLTHSETATGELKPDRRTVVKGAAAASIALPTYLRDFNYTQTARAQASGPVKVGFIEDESGNLAVYGIQKLHAAQLAVKEINDGKTLKGAPNIGAGILGAAAQVAKNPPVISKEGTGLDVVDDGGDKSATDLVYRGRRRYPRRFGREGRPRPRSAARFSGRPEQQHGLAAARPPHDPAGQGRRSRRGLRQRGTRGDPADRRSVQASSTSTPTSTKAGSPTPTLSAPARSASSR